MFDDLPYDVVLGMDLMDSKGLVIDRSVRTVSTPEHQDFLQCNLLPEATGRLPLFLRESVSLEPALTVLVTLEFRPAPGDERDVTQAGVGVRVGVVSPDSTATYPASLVVWSGLMNKAEGNTLQVWVSNFSDEQVVLAQDTLLAWWAPWLTEDAERLLVYARRSTAERAVFGNVR